MTRRSLITIRVAVLSTVVVGMAACAHARPAPRVAATNPAPATTTSAATPLVVPPTTATHQSPAGPFLGPTGYGALMLEMTRAQAVATGLTSGTSAAGAGACSGSGDGLLADAPGPGVTEFDGRLFFSATTGHLVAIYAYPGVKTPKGIGLGSTYAQMHAAYPTYQGIGDAINGRGGVAVPGNPQAHYRISLQAGKVAELSLDANDQDCYE